MSIKAVLNTRSGGLVAIVKVPFFASPPDVIVWNERHFVCHHAPADETLTWQYFEGFAWTYVPIHGEEVIE